MEEQVLTIRDLPTAYLLHQFKQADINAPILFFIHGFPDGPWSWKAQFNHNLKQSELNPPKVFAIVAPWGRGLGKSKAGVGMKRFYPESILLDHLAILRKIDPRNERKIVVIGHDIGSLYAWNLAQSLGHRLAGLVIMNGLNAEQLFRRWKSQHSQLLKSWYIGVFQLPYISDKIWSSLEEQILKFIHKIGKYPMLGPVKPSSYPKIKYAHSLQWYRAALRSFIQKELGFNMKSYTPLEVPVLAISGNSDPFVNPIQASELNAYAKDIEIRVLQAGHWPQLEKAPQVNRILDRFLDKVRGD